MSKFKAGDFIVHDHYGQGTILSAEEVFYKIDFGKRGIIEISKRSEEMLSFDDTRKVENGRENDVEAQLKELLENYFGPSKPIEIGQKWQNGTLVLQPSNKDLKGKEIPLDVFYQKIIRVRDRLRVLEQHINSHKSLSESEKIDFQQYITQIYGTLTTFNLLFRDENDHFVGQKS